MTGSTIMMQIITGQMKKQTDTYNRIAYTTLCNTTAVLDII